jgi:uncharacterized protein YdaU (DUF1376 family)
VNYYQYHITDFNNATRHLTRVERSIYRDLLDIYYDTEKPLQADLGRLARRVIAVSDEELQALEFVLSEFFILDGDVYRQERCDREIEEFHTKVNKKIEAGRASARARSKAASKQKVTGVEQVLNVCSANVELPSTHNPVPITKPKEYCAEPSGSPPPVEENAVALLPTNRYDSAGEQFPVTQSLFNEFQNAYPSVDVPQQLGAIRAWLITNKARRKTKSGMPKFINRWLGKEQDRGGSHASNQRGTGSGHAAPKLTAAQRIAAKRSQLAAQSPDLGTVATHDGNVRAPLDEPAGGRSERYLATGTH